MQQSRSIEEGKQMEKRPAVWPLILMFLACCTVVFAQEAAQSQESATAPAQDSAQQKNLTEYIELLRSDVRQQKAQIMGAVMALDVDEAAKFWPIYSEYNAELTKLNDFRIKNILEYAQSYDQMTDAKADELVQNAFSYRQQRSELIVKYYGRVKTSLGAIQAARFLQVEDQLLMLIDLQIVSALPIVGGQQ
jgi:hypothetical protein